jgi:cell division protein FtsB
VTLEDRVKLQLGELLWVNLNLAQQAEDAKADLAKLSDALAEIREGAADLADTLGGE